MYSLPPRGFEDASVENRLYPFHVTCPALWKNPQTSVSQTTFNYNKFKELVEIIEKKGYDISCVNTICNATEERQTEAKVIASTVDAMIIIGGKHSSNTQKLYEISKKECENTYYIQTLVDLDLSELKSIGNVGITADLVRAILKSVPFSRIVFAKQLFFKRE